MTDIAIRLPTSARSAQGPATGFHLRALLLAFVERIAGDPRAAREAEIAKYIQQNGGVLTDGMEREIGRRFGC